MTALHIRHFLPASRANGPGLRAVLWTQGCTLGCPGCFNPETHDAAGGEVVSVPELLARIEAVSSEVEGLTISGGEPLQQIAAVAELLQGVRTRTVLSVVLFTGFSWDEVERLRHGREGTALQALLGCVDVLIAGRYDQSRHVGRGLIGSANKTLHCLTSRYRAEDFADVPEAEVVLTPEGDVLLTGIAPLVLKSEEKS